MTVKLRREPALACPFKDFYGIVHKGEGFFKLPCARICPGQEGDMMRSPYLHRGGPVGRGPALW